VEEKNKNFQNEKEILKLRKS